MPTRRSDQLTQPNQRWHGTDFQSGNKWLLLGESTSFAILQLIISSLKMHVQRKLVIFERGEREEGRCSGCDADKKLKEKLVVLLFFQNLFN